MDSKAEKLLQRMRRSQAGWKYKDVETLLYGFGFEIRQGANHAILTHPDYPELRYTLPRHRGIRKQYVKDAVRIIDKLLELEDTKGNSEGGG